MPNKIKLTVVTALMPEAVALVDYYRLQKLKGARGFHLFYSDTLHVLVAGMGAARMRSGLRAYFEACPEARYIPNWLNLGIAGTRDVEVGKLCWAETIAKSTIGVPENADCMRISKVRSLNAPGQDYQADTLFDMEAESCLQWLQQNVANFSPAQLFCAKVVSDNQHDPSLKINRQALVSVFRALLKSPQKSPTPPLRKTIEFLLKT